MSPNSAPRIAAGGIVPVYSSVSAIQSGSWISIYGANLADRTYVWNNDFPTSLGGVTVTIDNKPAYLWFVSPTQINLQVPDDPATGLVSAVVTTPSGTVTSSVMLAPQGPSLSLLGDEKHVAGEILTPDGGYDLVGPANTFSYATRPVKAGETLVLYGVGFGATSPPVPAGQLFSGSAPTASLVTVYDRRSGRKSVVRGNHGSRALSDQCDGARGRKRGSSDSCKREWSADSLRTRSHTAVARQRFSL
jgi:uncharacterized protein (TIGR03437 family)